MLNKKLTKYCIKYCIILLFTTSLHCMQNNNNIDAFLVEQNISLYTFLNAYIKNDFNREFMDIFIKKKLDANYKDRYGQTPLITACKYNNLEIAKFLINNNATFNIIDFNGKSALDYATDNSSFTIINLLTSSKNIDNIYRCHIPGCHYSTIYKINLDRHKVNKHKITKTIPNSPIAKAPHSKSTSTTTSNEIINLLLINNANKIATSHQEADQKTILIDLTIENDSNIKSNVNLEAAQAMLLLKQPFIRKK